MERKPRPHACVFKAEGTGLPANPSCWVILGLEPRIHISKAMDPRVEPEDDTECLDAAETNAKLMRYDDFDTIAALTTTPPLHLSNRFG